MTISALVVDDHPIWADGLARDLGENGVTVVGTAADGETAVRLASAMRPDVVVMDLRLPGMSGAVATQLIQTAVPTTRVLVLSAVAEQPDVLDAVMAGAAGYLVKTASLPEVLDAIRRVARGESVFTPDVAGVVLGEYRRRRHEQSDAATLTDREAGVLRLVAKGMTSRQIADRLGISPRTVDNHVQAVLRKLRVRNRVELARFAIEYDLDQD